LDNTIKVSSIVETTGVCSEDGKHTFEITKFIKGVPPQRKAIMILLYPTKDYNTIGRADDLTTTFIMQHLNDPDIQITELKIINLFSQVVNGKLSTRGIPVDEMNLRYIESEILSKKSFKDYLIIVGWGGSLKSCQSANETKFKLLTMIQKHNPSVKVLQLSTSQLQSNNTGNIHPLALGIRAREEWILIPFDVTEFLSSRQNASLTK
jgi:hypothetical protein